MPLAGIYVVVYHGSISAVAKQKFRVRGFDMSKMRNIFLKVLGIIFITFVFIEICSFVSVKLNLLLINETPQIYRHASVDNVSEWRTEQDIWGAWHEPNGRAHHSGECFSADYTSNNVGARDKDFVVEKTGARFILLGDSFAEGYGVQDAEMAKNLLQRQLGVEIYNFGSGGDFGPLQYWLIYDRLARKYQHDGVMIFFLPANDFTDNDYGYWNALGISAKRYRPYYKKLSENEYDLFVPDDAMKQEQLRRRSKSRNEVLRSFIIEHFWFANVIRTIKVALLMKKIQEYEKSKSSHGAFTYSGYFDSSIEQQKAAVFFIDKIVKSVEGKVVLVAIPRLEDFLRIKEGANRSELYWWSSFNTAQQRLHKPVKFIDLIDFPPQDNKELADLYFSCDGHWSPYGNQWAANQIVRELEKVGWHCFAGER